MRPLTALAPTRLGTMIYLSSDMYVGRSLEVYGEFSTLEWEAFSYLVQPGMVVADIGANIGAHTLWFAQAVGPTGLVYAWEPQRFVHQVLCGNLALNGVTNVRATLGGVGRTNGTLRVPAFDYGAENNFGGVGLGHGDGGESVPVIALDALRLDRLDFAKIDVEGMERDVLLGARKTLQRLRPALYVENDRPDRSDALIATLDELGYRCYWHRPPLYNPANYRRNAVNIFGDILSHNMVCLHRDSGMAAEGLEPVEVAVARA